MITHAGQSWHGVGQSNPYIASEISKGMGAQESGHENFDEGTHIWWFGAYIKIGANKFIKIATEILEEGFLLVAFSFVQCLMNYMHRTFYSIIFCHQCSTVNSWTSGLPRVRYFLLYSTLGYMTHEQWLNFECVLMPNSIHELFLDISVALIETVNYSSWSDPVNFKVI